LGHTRSRRRHRERSRNSPGLCRRFSHALQRISIFTSLPLRSLDKLALQRQLDAIGRSKGSAA